MATNGLSRQDASRARRLGEVHSEADVETDAEQALALQRGDPGAPGRIYDRHAQAVHRVVYRLLGPGGELDDIVQEVFIYAFSSIDKLREPAALRSWLLGIAAGKVRAYLRRRSRRRWLSFLPNEELAELPASGGEPDVGLLQEVYAVLGRLPPDERLALVVHHVEGLPVHEAAVLCGMSISTFKRRCARGESLFMARARHVPALAGWLKGEAR